MEDKIKLLNEALYEINRLQVKYKKKSERKIRYPKINGEECITLQDADDAYGAGIITSAQLSRLQHALDPDYRSIPQIHYHELYKIFSEIGNELHDQIHYHELFQKEMVNRAETGKENVIPYASFENLPTVDVVPVIHAHWIKEKKVFGQSAWRCAHCGNFLNVRNDTFNAGRGECNYCPHCGAKMDERTEEIND